MLTPLQLRKRTRVDEPTDSAGLSEREAALLQQVAALRLQLDAQTAELSTLRALSSSPRLRDGMDGCVFAIDWSRNARTAGWRPPAGRLGGEAGEVELVRCLFVGVVFPGTVLVTRMLRLSPTLIQFDCSSEGRLVLAGGQVQLRAAAKL